MGPSRRRREKGLSSIREGENQGIGVKTGQWKREADVTRAGSRAKRLAGLVPRD